MNVICQNLVLCLYRKCRNNEELRNQVAIVYLRVKSTDQYRQGMISIGALQKICLEYGINLEQAALT